MKESTSRIIAKQLICNVNRASSKTGLFKFYLNKTSSRAMDTSAIKFKNMDRIFDLSDGDLAKKILRGAITADSKIQA